jgi:hypothetical protein
MSPNVRTQHLLEPTFSSWDSSVVHAYHWDEKSEEVLSVK